MRKEEKGKEMKKLKKKNDENKGKNHVEGGGQEVNKEADK